MKYVYHGSNTPNLKIIKRNRSTHNKDWVYGTYSKAIATIFLSSKGNDLYYSLSGNENDHPIELVERKKDMFKNIFNVFGSIYKLNSKNFKENMTGWTSEVISEYDEKVLSEEHINNILVELINLDKKNELKLYLYPDKPNYVPLDNSDLIPKVKNWVKNGFDVNKFFEIYPELKDKYNN